MNSLTISTEEYHNFMSFLEDATGIVLGGEKDYLVVSRLKRLMQSENIQNFHDLIAEADKNQKLKGSIIDAMTTNETSWYRDAMVFECMIKNIFPALLKSPEKNLRIWSAACSTGQEPYSISMEIEDYITKNRTNNVKFEITGTDISRKVLDKAELGCYEDLVTSRGLPDEKKSKYFKELGLYWQISEKIKNRVKFETVNLKKDFSVLGKFDLVFCRNVLIYFSPSMKKDVLSRITNQIKPGGYLVLGGSESMSDYSDRFEMHKYNSVVYYQLKQR